ncbi:MAG: TPM domain-containing protein [Myxococcota bacterium]|nr:TPM domain-containing protein [Myxococcota bacterium]
MALRGRLVCLASGLAIGLAIFAADLAVAEFRVPSLRGAVVDDAGMLSKSARTKIEAALHALAQRGKTQLAVLTMPSLEGLTIEQASIRVTDQWQLGDEKRDDGVLLMIARDERRIRIEVGQGLEGALTDAWTKRIIDEAMTPLFRAGDVDGGVMVGVFEIAKRTNPDVDLRAQLEGASRRSSRRERSRSTGSGSSSFPILLFILIAFARAGIFGGYRRRGRYLWGAPMIGGGMGGSRGGFSGGFGGFSGGGGGFSGGGASGGW